MSDKMRGLVVTFGEDISEEYFDKIKSAIECFSPVINVNPVVDNFELQIIEQRIKFEYGKKLFEILI
jgi:hypothetical protein